LRVSTDVASYEFCQPESGWYVRWQQNRSSDPPDEEAISTDYSNADATRVVKIYSACELPVHCYGQLVELVSVALHLSKSSTPVRNFGLDQERRMHRIGHPPDDGVV
jgi:hypothetical protein